MKEETIGERIRQLRKELHLTQAEFAEKIGLKPTAVLMYEKGSRKVTEQSLSLIVQNFGVNESWLRYGTGEIMQRTDETLLAQLADEYHLSADQQVLVKSFLSLTSEQRASIVDAVCDAAAAIQRAREQRKADSIDAKVEAYRQELEAAEKGQSLSTTGSADTDADKVQKA